MKNPVEREDEWKGLIYYRDKAWETEDHEAERRFWCGVFLTCVIVAVVLAVRP